MKKLYRTEQVRELESLTYSKKMDTEIGLMNKAGEAAFRSFSLCWPDAQSMLVVAGSGNNAGDGFVLARLAKQAGLSVQVIIFSPLNAYQEPAKEALEACLATQVEIQEYSGQIPNTADVIVDALFGIGLHGNIADIYKTAIEQMNASQKPLFSLDIPSGLDANTGTVHGIAVKANVTATFIALKQGLYTHNAPAHCGRIILHDLQLQNSLFQTVPSSAKLIDWEHCQQHFPKRERDADKGLYGHVLIIGGDYGMGGAVRMAAEGALRVGSGLVTVATRPEHVPVVSTNRPEIMCHQVASRSDLEPLLEKATVVVIGPGLGKTEWAEMLLNTVLTYDHPKLLDADALNLLSKQPTRRENWVLTPHPGEAGRLLDMSSQEIQFDRFASAIALQKKYGGIVVLKGAGSIVQKDDDLPYVCPAGNPGMASGGTGDVLSGVIGGFMAQKLSPYLAATVGVMAHAKAADRAAEEGGERGLLATDLMNHLRELVNPEEK